MEKKTQIAFLLFTLIGAHCTHVSLELIYVNSANIHSGFCT